MAGYAIMWIFFTFIGLLLLSTIAGYYAARFIFWLRNYWMGR